MPTGVLINVGTVFFGGLFGGFLGEKLSNRFKTQLMMVFGVC